ncbi:hypothetical protein [Ruminococcus flavefaciens]|uniref:PD-(D/E)XK nuclease domain-containing protein n=1 Tax=Ruminococcus flavefaciens TaxID=1265 RepID=UPI00048FAE5E|nr:hypothetical protein [Ruminococcus flavefaciens]
MTDIEKLKEIIDEIDVLIEHKVKDSTPEFKAWHNKAKSFMYHHFGSDSPEYDDFCSIRFSFRGNLMKHTPDSIYIESCKKGLDTAKLGLQNYLTELSDSESDTFDSEKEIERIFTRFKEVALQLTRRHAKRETLIINDEYDVQDLLHSLLKMYFDDVRDEEPVPSYAGGSSRTDFYIPDIKTFIEVKKTRSGLKDKELRDQLIIDIEQYQKHQGCEKIYCFVYDPDRKLRNPAGIKKDLEEKHQGLVRVFIES